MGYNYKTKGLVKLTLGQGDIQIPQYVKCCVTHTNPAIKPVIGGLITYRSGYLYP